MPTKDPLNRYILDVGFLEVGLRTSLEPWPGPGPGPGSSPGSSPGARILDPSISDLSIIHLFSVKRPYEPI